MKLDMSAATHVKPPMVRRDTTDSSTSESSSASNSSTDALEGCLDLLRSIKGTTPTAKPKDEWQPDQDTVLCNNSQCSAMFGQGKLSLGPRRHHCRHCGMIFCGSHSSRTWPLQTVDSSNRPVVLPLRVCDGCHSAFTEDPTSPVCAAPASASSASLATETVLFSETYAAERTASIGRSLSSSAVDSLQPRLAPVADWMDRCGVLSLYPLATQSSHSRTASPVAPRSAGPLFAPTALCRRTAKERELERRTLRRRQKEVSKAAFISTPAGSDAGSDYEDDFDTPLALDTRDPIFGFGAHPRDRKKAVTDAARGPADWSTF
ncbi:hypothetical protein VHUM_03815 [Vanrija humicola]|uniref:FYVE-type domain-containing protein n=1 Tax=Vanrija humicola TaxID=5417 RepID=A0A7D8UWL8_VANHU|nr:hypothetical protein VHUM_03815 [Vanrija humicola]